MAQLLAPYHNGMRLGQGFNSFTQQICLDNAVVVNSDENWERLKKYHVDSSHQPDPNGRTKRSSGIRKISAGTRSFDNDVEAEETTGGANHGW